MRCHETPGLNRGSIHLIEYPNRLLPKKNSPANPRHGVLVNLKSAKKIRFFIYIDVGGTEGQLEVLGPVQVNRLVYFAAMETRSSVFFFEAPD